MLDWLSHWDREVLQRSVLHIRPLRERVARDLESQALRLCHCRVQTHGRDGRGDKHY
jgi:hypothetical protein